MQLSKTLYALLFTGSFLTSNIYAAPAPPTEEHNKAPAPKQRNVGKGKAVAKATEEKPAFKFLPGQQFQGRPIISTFKDPQGTDWGVFLDDAQNPFGVNLDGTVAALAPSLPAPGSSGPSFQGNPIISKFTDNSGIEWGVFKDPQGKTWGVNRVGEVIALDVARQPAIVQAAVPAFGGPQTPLQNFTDAQGNNWTTFQANTGQSWAVNQFGEFAQLPEISAPPQAPLP